MQRPTSPRNSTALGTWSAGEAPDALSKLVSGGIFHLQKCYMLVECVCGGGEGAMHPLIPPLDPPLLACLMFMFFPSGHEPG